MDKFAASHVLMERRQI